MSVKRWSKSEEPPSTRSQLQTSSWSLAGHPSFPSAACCFNVSHERSLHSQTAAPRFRAVHGPVDPTLLGRSAAAPTRCRTLRKLRPLSHAPHTVLPELPQPGHSLEHSPWRRRCLFLHCGLARRARRHGPAHTLCPRRRQLARCRWRSTDQQCSGRPARLDTGRVSRSSSVGPDLPPCGCPTFHSHSLTPRKTKSCSKALRIDTSRWMTLRSTVWSAAIARPPCFCPAIRRPTPCGAGSPRNWQSTTR